MTYSISDVLASNTTGCSRKNGTKYAMQLVMNYLSQDCDICIKIHSP